MAHDPAPECTGKCQMVDTYKTINKALTKQNSEYKEALASVRKENVELHQIVMELRTEIIESKKSRPMNVKDAIDVVSIASEAFASISQIVQQSGLKLSEFNSKLLLPHERASTSLFNGTNVSSPSRTASSSLQLQPKTPTNISRIRPIIRTPNGLLQNVSISLPRIDQSLLLSVSERFANSTAVSEDLSQGVDETIFEDQAITDTTLYDTQELPPTLPRLPRHTSELNLESTESPPNPQLYAQAEAEPEEEYNDEGLSIIPEVTEIEYTANGSRLQESSDSSGGEEINAHRVSRQSVRANKENNLRVSRNMSISEASCSTPYATANTRERLSDMKVAKVVLQQLNMDDIPEREKKRNDSESSEQSVEPEAAGTSTITKKRKARKRKDSERSVNSETDDETSHSTRPKRRVTPVSFKEPSLSTKLRRP